MRVKFLGRLRRLTGTDELLVQADDIGDLMNRLRTRYGWGFERVYSSRTSTLAEDIHVLVNGRNLALLAGLDTRLCENDVVVVFEVMAGG